MKQIVKRKPFLTSLVVNFHYNPPALKIHIPNAGISTQNQYWIGLERSSAISFAWTYSQLSPTFTMWVDGEPTFGPTDTVVQLLSTQSFKYAVMWDAAPGYPLCEIGTAMFTISSDFA